MSTNDLQKIMDEIDNLEKEFDKEEEATASPTETKDPPTFEAPENVVPMDPSRLASEKEATSAPREVAFEMLFEIGGNCAKLRVDGREGLLLQAEGVSFRISAERISFCTEDGGEFTMPWKKDSSLRKSA